MTRLEVMTVLLSLKALLEKGDSEKALEVINEILEEARTVPKQ
jgi:pentatricopeptide repeat protein